MNRVRRMCFYSAVGLLSGAIALSPVIQPLCELACGPVTEHASGSAVEPGPTHCADHDGQSEPVPEPSCAGHAHQAVFAAGTSRSTLPAPRDLTANFDLVVKESEDAGAPLTVLPAFPLATHSPPSRAILRL